MPHQRNNCPNNGDCCCHLRITAVPGSTKKASAKFPAKIDADLVNNFNGAESHIKAALCQDRQKSRLQLIADIRLVNPAR
jgi:hypothetical protein